MHVYPYLQILFKRTESITKGNNVPGFASGMAEDGGT